MNGLLLIFGVNSLLTWAIIVPFSVLFVVFLTTLIADYVQSRRTQLESNRVLEAELAATRRRAAEAEVVLESSVSQIQKSLHALQDSLNALQDSLQKLIEINGDNILATKELISNLIITVSASQNPKATE